ncbi:hypothetical protein XA68_11523 [Ophiocordyceps unilateralis]|uniref:Sister chromatid cohesion protein DCC1 n=1 Tax=Ophiocordyceps unilateralis TaxID=268505 RepID=A0A2A9PF70_OPHUN|nr:hypothetical protein XA68_11523 [Ophiocordyceps unilateralis]
MPSIPLNHNPPTTNYRLLELPPEVEALLESSTAPALTLDDNPETSTAVLRTPNSSFLLRQKNTSNALLLLSVVVPGLAVVATLHETVELTALPSKPADPGSLRHDGSGGRWHERFGRNR